MHAPGAWVSAVIASSQPTRGRDLYAEPHALHCSLGYGRVYAETPNRRVPDFILLRGTVTPFEFVSSSSICRWLLEQRKPVLPAFPVTAMLAYPSREVQKRQTEQMTDGPQRLNKPPAFQRVALINCLEQRDAASVRRTWPGCHCQSTCVNYLRITNEIVGPIEQSQVFSSCGSNRRIAMPIIPTEYVINNAWPTTD